MRNWPAAALCLAALTFAGTAQAQENATLTLQSGERVSGQLLDLGGMGIAVRVNGEEREVPTSEVSVIDFTGLAMAAVDWATVRDGQQVLMLKNGDAVTGQLYDISGTTPLKITFRTSAGDLQFSSSDIGRIVLAKPAGGVAASLPTVEVVPPVAPDAVAVARAAWRPTATAVHKRAARPGRASTRARLSTRK